MQPGDPSRSAALTALLGTTSVDDFVSAYYPGRHLAVHGSLDRLPTFFYSGVLAEPRALASAYRGPVYVTNRRLGRLQVHGIDPRECFEELGLTVGFVEVEQLIPEADAWLRDLERDLGLPRGCATIAVFVNGPGSGLSVHCDPHEHFAIHLRGPKAFRVTPSPAPFPHMKHVPGAPTPPQWLAQAPTGLLADLPADAERVELRPGSVLYTPRGLYHETLAGAEPAMTAVIALQNPTPAELLTTYLLKVLMQSEEWRRPLDFGWAEDPARRAPARARMAALLAQAATRIADLSVPQMFGAVEPGAAGLTDATRLQRDPSTRVTLRDAGADRVRLEVALELGAGQVTSAVVPVALRPLLDWLASTPAPFTLGDACARFPDWDRSAVASTIASLVRTRALVEIPFEPW